MGKHGESAPLRFLASVGFEIRNDWMSWESGLGVFRPSLRGERCDVAVGATCLCAGCVPMASWGTS